MLDLGHVVDQNNIVDSSARSSCEDDLVLPTEDYRLTQKRDAHRIYYNHDMNKYGNFFMHSRDSIHDAI